ncbi:hypothetical protein D3C80_1747580 [compost metagenome]
MTRTKDTVLAEIKIEESRSRYPLLSSDLVVDDIHCNPGWRGILSAFCDTLQKHSNRHPNIDPLTVGHNKSKLSELHFFYKGGGD